MSELHVTFDGQSYTFQPGQTVRIGRSSDNTVIVADPTVSRQHAQLSLGQDGWVFECVGRAATFLRGEPVTRIVVNQPVDLALATPQGPVLRIEPDSTAALQAHPPDRGLPDGRRDRRFAGGPQDRERLPPGRRWAEHQPACRASQRRAGDGSADPDTGQELAHEPRLAPALAASGHTVRAAPAGVHCAVRLVPEPDHARMGVQPLRGAALDDRLLAPDPPRADQEAGGADRRRGHRLRPGLDTARHDQLGNPQQPIHLIDALGVGINEETTKALPILLAALLVLRLRMAKLDVRMWMFLGTVAGLTFGVAEAALYTPGYIVDIHSAVVNSQAVAPVLAFADRVFVDGFDHAIWAGVSAFFIGMAVNYPRRRVQLILFGVAMAAVLHALNDWTGPHIWVQVAVQAVSLFLFLGYTMSAAAIERQVRWTPIFRGGSILMDSFSESSEAGS